MKKILVVEDNVDSRRMLVRLLMSMDYEVFEADDGISAWELFQHDPTPLVITDWRMDAMDGLELTLLIRESDFSESTFVIMVTAFADSIDAANGRAAGVDDYLTKPLDLDVLQQKVEEGFQKLIVT